MVLMSTCKYSPVTHQLSSLEAIYRKVAACMPCNCQTDHLMTVVMMIIFGM